MKNFFLNIRLAIASARNYQFQETVDFIFIFIWSYQFIMQKTQTNH